MGEKRVKGDLASLLRFYGRNGDIVAKPVPKMALRCVW